jgi:hypothetical protein
MDGDQVVLEGSRDECEEEGFLIRNLAEPWRKVTVEPA